MIFAEVTIRRQAAFPVRATAIVHALELLHEASWAGVLVLAVQEGVAAESL